MKIVMHEWRYWVVEYETMEYPAREYPAYMASPIYQNDEWKLEMRRAGADWLSSKYCEETNLTEKQISEIKESIQKFLFFCKKIMKKDFSKSDECKIFEKFISDK